MAAENEDVASPKAVAEQNGAAGSKSEVDLSAPALRDELDSNVQFLELAAASGYWKYVVVGEEFGAKVETTGDSEVASSSDDGLLAGPNVINVFVVASDVLLSVEQLGGLGDVGALPKASARRGHRIMCLIPSWLSCHVPSAPSSPRLPHSSINKNSELANNWN